MKIYCDGGSRGNPGPAASAFVVVNESGDVIYKESKYIGTATNNVAEYTALLMALSWAKDNAHEGLAVVLDSELVTRQMNGEYKIKSPSIKPLALRAKEIERSLGVGVLYEHTKRDGNKTADALVNSALDRQRDVE